MSAMSCTDEEEFDNETHYTHFRDLTGIKPVDSMNLLSRNNSERDKHYNAVMEVLRNPKKYKFLPDKLRDDKDVICALVYAKPDAIRSLKGTFRTDKDIIWHALSRDPGQIIHVDDELLADKTLLVFALFTSVNLGSGFFPISILRGQCREFYKEVGEAAKLHFALDPHNIKATHQIIFSSMVDFAFFDDIDIVKLYFWHISPHQVVSVYNDYLSDEAKILPNVIRALATMKVLTLDYTSTDLLIPDSVWDSRDTMLHLLCSHGILFRLASHRLRSDGDFVMQVIEHNSWNIHGSIDDIVAYVSGVLRTSRTEFLKWVVSPLGRVFRQNSLPFTLFGQYSSWFSDFEFLKESVNTLLKNQPQTLIEVLKYESVHDIISDIKKVSEIGNLLVGTFYDNKRELELTKALIAKVVGAIDAEAANCILFGNGERLECQFDRRRVSAVSTVLMGMSPTAKKDLLTSILSFGGSDGRNLDETLPSCDDSISDTERYKYFVDKLALNIINKVTLTSDSDLILSMMDGCTDTQIENLLSAFMKGSDEKCNDVYFNLAHWDYVKAYKTLVQQEHFDHLTSGFRYAAVALLVEYINDNKECKPPGETIMQWTKIDTNDNIHTHSLVLINQPSKFSLTCTHTPPSGQQNGAPYQSQPIFCTSTSSISRFFKEMQQRFFVYSNFTAKLPESLKNNGLYELTANNPNVGFCEERIGNLTDYTSVFSRSTYLRSICYKANKQVTLKVYERHAPPVEKNNVNIVLAMLNPTTTRYVANLISDSLKQEPAIVRKCIILLGKGMHLSDGINEADIDDSLWWRTEKRLLLIAYKNHHDRSDTMNHIYFLRSFYYDLFHFDATEAERNERSVLPKRGKPPAHYVNVLPENSDDAIQKMSDRRARSEMINGWSHAVGEISRGLKMVEMFTSKGKSTSVQTIDDRFSSASVTITKLCEKINEFLCRTTGQAQVVDMMYDMHEIDEDDGDEQFTVHQQAAINTFKSYHKKRKRTTVPINRGRGKKNNGMSTSALMPSDDEDEDDV